MSYSHSNCLNVVKNISYFSKLYKVTFTLDQQYSIDFLYFSKNKYIILNLAFSQISYIL